MFHSLFSRFAKGKALVIKDVKELNEEHMRLFTTTPPGTIIHLSVGNSNGVSSKLKLDKTQISSQKNE